MGLQDIAGHCPKHVNRVVNPRPIRRIWSWLIVGLVWEILTISYYGFSVGVDIMNDDFLKVLMEPGMLISMPVLC